MTQKKKIVYTPKFRAKVAESVMSGEETITSACKRFKVSRQSITIWIENIRTGKISKMGRPKKYNV